MCKVEAISVLEGLLADIRSALNTTNHTPIDSVLAQRVVALETAIDELKRGGCGVG